MLAADASGALAALSGDDALGGRARFRLQRDAIRARFCAEVRRTSSM